MFARYHEIARRVPQGYVTGEKQITVNYVTLKAAGSIARNFLTGIEQNKQTRAAWRPSMNRTLVNDPR